ncbi:MBL fold metallo-hydrolase [Tissierella sp. Yu-01]|uniref:MBL fold metallo-hydrolase RNA specificity domain-containing protein n=1 Tax=Tissierella sp. Yu-01 TaxID=3035694 RepID=UPI00240D0857|nr:MBL fold metallo-hydrolase [Tissierella sp. Yu-01]WFA09458.1 MBL fold metallo-hydrolase [Tissierella sp. Yu-01]
MDIQFFGAAKMVTGSNILLSTKNHNILIDCGMFQGNKEKERMNYMEFPFNPKDIDLLLLTHAHIDHSGRIPKLVKDGFKGDVISTKATADLCEIMLKDSAKIQESDAEWENKKRVRAGLSEIEPLYTMEDVENSLKHFKPYYYNQRISLNDEISIRFKDAGHILGSSILEIWVNEEGKNTKVVFSGDLGMPGRPIINNPDYIDEADYLIVESTYGDTVHEPFEKSTLELIDVIERTALRGGTVLIPSFSVGRTQELIYELNKYYEYNEIEEYMRIPVYVDSPLAVNATEVFQRNSNSFNKETTDMILLGDNPFTFRNLRYVKSQEESIALNKANFPKVIISSSGMATAGRIRHHLKHNLWNPLNSLVFVGYQAEGTLGRILLDGAKKIKLLGEEINVALEIYDLEGFSGHADQKMLMKWIRNFKSKPKKIFLVHGEEDASQVLSNLIKEYFKIEAIIPSLGEKFNIKKDFVEVKKGISIEPVLLKEDIEKELESVYNQFNALFSRSEHIYDDKILEKNYDILKNRLIEIQDQLMDLNILISK